MHEKRTHALKMPKTRPPGCPDFSQISPENLQWIQRCAARALQVSKGWHALDANGEQRAQVMELQGAAVEVDFAVVHLLRGLNVRALFFAPDLEFMAEHAAIEKNIDRARFFFPVGVNLCFALNGATINSHN